MKLKPLAFGLSIGCVWGVGLAIATVWAVAAGIESVALAEIGIFYVGYTVTPIGAVVGLAWGFVDGLIGGALIAWLYNRFAGAAAS